MLAGEPPASDERDRKRNELYMVFTCGRCNTRAVKGFSRQAYEHGAHFSAEAQARERAVELTAVCGLVLQALCWLTALAVSHDIWLRTGKAGSAPPAAWKTSWCAQSSAFTMTLTLIDHPAAPAPGQAEEGEAIIKRGGAGEDAVEITEEEMAGWSKRKGETSTDDASDAPAAPR